MHIGQECLGALNFPSPDAISEVQGCMTALGIVYTESMRRWKNEEAEHVLCGAAPHLRVERCD